MTGCIDPGESSGRPSSGRAVHPLDHVIGDVVLYQLKHVVKGNISHRWKIALVGQQGVAGQVLCDRVDKRCTCSCPAIHFSSGVSHAPK